MNHMVIQDDHFISAGNKTAIHPPHMLTRPKNMPHRCHPPAAPGKPIMKPPSRRPGPAANRPAKQTQLCEHNPLKTQPRQTTCRLNKEKIE